MVLLCNEDESLVMKKLTQTPSGLAPTRLKDEFENRATAVEAFHCIYTSVHKTQLRRKSFIFKRLQSNTSQDYEMSPKKYDSKSLLHISCVFLNFAWPPRRRHVRLIQINFPNRVLIQNNFPPVWAPWAHCGGQVGSFCMKWLVGWST